jgi:hypothetical protein
MQSFDTQLVLQRLLKGSIVLKKSVLRLGSLPRVQGRDA